MPLVTLPPEILLSIAERLPNLCSINALSRCSRLLNEVFNLPLYQYDGAYYAAERAVAYNTVLPLQGLKRVGISLNECGVDVLHKATESGLLGLINYVLDTGEIDINSRGYQSHHGNPLQGATPLYIAVYNQWEDVTKLLLDCGANPSVRCGPDLSWCPLALAAVNDKFSIAVMLFAAGADVSCPNPVIRAALKGKLGMVTMLLDAGADLFATDSHGVCLFRAAFRSSKCGSLVEMLLTRGSFDPADGKNDYLTSAVRLGWYKVVRMLIQKGADIEYREFGDRSMPLLMEAIDWGQYGNAWLLIQQGADVNARGPDQSCALHYACRNKHFPLVKCLLAAGADVSAINAAGHQPLDLACEAASPDFVNVLLDHGADISATNPLGMSALYSAAGFGHLSVVELLLKRGADVEQGGKLGETPLMMAARKGHSDVVDILISHGAKLESTNAACCTALLAAAEEAQADVVDVLISNGANVQAKNSKGSNALIVAAAVPSNKSTVDRLLEDGRINVDAQNVYGRTALISAAMRGHVEAVKSLLAHQPPADVTIEDHWGATALSMAVRNGHARIVEMLLAAPNPSPLFLGRKDSHGRSVLDWARRTDTSVIWRMLAAAPGGAAVDMIEEEEEVMMRFRPTGCYCDVCGRCKARKSGMMLACSTCSGDRASTLGICKFCVEDGINCVKGHDAWTAKECNHP